MEKNYSSFLTEIEKTNQMRLENEKGTHDALTRLYLVELTIIFVVGILCAIWH